MQLTVLWLPYEEGGSVGLAMSASADILDSVLGRMLRPVGRNKAKDMVTETMLEIKMTSNNGSPVVEATPRWKAIRRKKTSPRRKPAPGSNANQRLPVSRR